MPPDDPALDAAIAASEAALVAAIGQPRRAVVDGAEVEQQSIPDQIALDRYLRGRKAGNSPARGLRFTRLIPPGTT